MMLFFYMSEAAFGFANCHTCVLKNKKKRLCHFLNFFIYEYLGI